MQPSNTSGPREHAARACERATAMLRSGSPEREILTILVSAAEEIAGTGSVSSILILDSFGLLRNGASPNLPADYLNAIDRLKPSPTVGTCAAAAATGKHVITPDFTTDDKWAELRHLPLALGFLGAWSTPIKSERGAVLGTFGTYYRERRGPSPDELSTIPLLADAAAAVLASTRKSACG